MKMQWLGFLLLILGACGGGPTIPPEADTFPRPGKRANDPLRATPILPSPPVLPTISAVRSLANGIRICLHHCPSSKTQKFALRLDPATTKEPNWFLTLAARCLVPGGHKTYPGDALRESLAKDGITIALKWEYGAPVIYMETSPEAWTQAITALALLVITPAYPSNVMERILADGVGETQSERPSWATLTTNDPPPTIGFPKIPEDLPTTKELRDWHKNTFSPTNASFATTGPLTGEEIQMALERTLALWPKNPEASPPLYPALPEPGLYWTDRSLGKQAALTIILPLGPAWSENWGPRRILAQILGGNGQGGRLSQALRSQGCTNLEIRNNVKFMPSGVSFLTLEITELAPAKLLLALEIACDILSSMADTPVTSSEMSRSLLGARCREGVILQEPKSALQRALAFARMPAPPTDGSPLDLPLDGVSRTSLTALRGAAPGFLPAKAIFHASAPAKYRQGPRFPNAVVLAADEPGGTSPFTPDKPAAPADPAAVKRARILLTQAATALGLRGNPAPIHSIRISGITNMEDGLRVGEEWLISADRLERTRRILGLEVRYVAVTGREPLMISADQTSPLPATSIALLKADLGLDILWLLSRLDPAKENTMILGTKLWEDIPLTQLRLGPAGPKATILSIDSLSGLVRMVHHTIPQGTVRDILTDYRDLQPFRHPFRIERWKRDQRLWTLSVKSIAVERKAE